MRTRNPLGAVSSATHIVPGAEAVDEALPCRRSIAQASDLRGFLHADAHCERHDRFRSERRRQVK